jgi:3D-(3,5/4)-trihydroxycyclohexane-1,2-dione acylhydrolase (decyclizing)
MTSPFTMAQAVVRFLDQQYVSRAGVETKVLAGIFGHSNVAGMGEALEQYPAFPYYLGRNEQTMMHTATPFAKTSNRLQGVAQDSSGTPELIAGPSRRAN